MAGRWVRALTVSQRGGTPWSVLRTFTCKTMLMVQAASHRSGNNLKGLGGLEPESQGQNLALTVLCVPYSLKLADLHRGGRAGVSLVDVFHGPDTLDVSNFIGLMVKFTQKIRACNTSPGPNCPRVGLTDFKDERVSAQKICQLNRHPRCRAAKTP